MEMEHPHKFLAAMSCRKLWPSVVLNVSGVHAGPSATSTSPLDRTRGPSQESQSQPVTEKRCQRRRRRTTKTEGRPALAVSCEFRTSTPSRSRDFAAWSEVRNKYMTTVAFCLLVSHCLHSTNVARHCRVVSDHNICLPPARFSR